MLLNITKGGLVRPPKARPAVKVPAPDKKPHVVPMFPPPVQDEPLYSSVTFV